MALTHCLGCHALTSNGTHCRRCNWRARRKISSGGAWRDRRNAVRLRDRVCVRCGSADRLEVHHRVALVDGGSNQLHNLELLCHRCHTSEDVL